MEEILKDIELVECPLCQGTGTLEEENGWCVYVACVDCGCHTAEVAFRNEEERAVAYKKAADTWNFGKVITNGNGE